MRVTLPLAGVVGFLVSVQSGFGPLVLLPGGVVLAISYYGRRQPSLVTSWTGAKLGMSVGLLSFAFFGLFFGMESAANVPAYHQEMTKLVQDVLARQPSPETQQLAQLFDGPHGIAVITTMFLASTFFFLVLVSGVAGALAGAFSRSRRTGSGSVSPK